MPASIPVWFQVIRQPAMNRVSTRDTGDKIHQGAEDSDFSIAFRDLAEANVPISRQRGLTVTSWTSLLFGNAPPNEGGTRGKIYLVIYLNTFVHHAHARPVSYIL